MIAFQNHQYLSENQVQIALSDLGLNRGYAVFDFIRIQQGVPLFVNDHLYRFFQAANYLHLHVGYQPHQLKYIIEQLIQRNQLTNGAIKILLTGGPSADGYTHTTPNLIITAQFISSTATQSFKILTYPYQKPMSHVKTTNYSMAIWLQPLLKKHQADDVLYTVEDFVTECPRCNIFFIDAHHKIITPSEHILAGVTRKKVLEMAAQKFVVETRPVHLSELASFTAAFITSTTKKILPIRAIDEFPYASSQHPVVLELQQLFSALEVNYIANYKFE